MLNDNLILILSVCRQFCFVRGPPGFDRTRNAVIGNKNFDLTYLEEAYTSEHWLVRIYRVKKPHEFNRPAIKPDERTVQSSYFVSKKVCELSFFFQMLFRSIYC